MLVDNVQASIRFYQGLGFHVAATEMDAAGHPLWALLRRDDADLFVMARGTWSVPGIPLPARPTPMTLVLDGEGALQSDPDGAVVQAAPPALRRAA